MKNTKKTTEKAVKSTKKTEVFVNLTNYETIDDVYFAYGLGKHNAGLPLTDSELLAMIDFCSTVTVIEKAPIVCYLCEKRTPWYKRFWNWLTRKK